MNYNNILAQTIRSKGGTFTQDGEVFAPEYGYAVGIYAGTYARIPVDDLDDNFNPAINSVMAMFPDDLIGTWMHDGAIHIDPVVWIGSRSLAFATARRTNQIAIFDFCTGVTINV